MPRRDRTFTEVDILRFIANNLDSTERDRVICDILELTGHSGGTISNKTIFRALKSLISGPLRIIGLTFEIAEAISGEGKYSPDF